MTKENNGTEEYLVVSGTNRKGSHTIKVAGYYLRLLEEYGVPARLLSLQHVNALMRNDEVRRIERELLIPATKFIFVVPEYNGSYPGILKLLIDCTDIRKSWHYKKALLAGVATGRAGNLRGMDHLSDTLQYLKMTVHYNKLPISKIDQHMDADGNLDDETREAIQHQTESFLTF